MSNLVKFVPVESKQYPGYYEISGFSKYVISKYSKRVIRKIDGAFIPTHISAGYLYCSLFSDKAGERRSEAIHRLMAFAFLGPEPVYENDIATVNHKDGVKTNNDSDNLEWCTRSYNSKHAWLTGLTPVDLIPVYVLNELTGKETRYESIVECGEILNFDPSTISQRLRFGPNRVWPGYLRFRKQDVIFQPFTVQETEDSLNKYHSTGNATVYIYDIKQGIELRFDTITDCAKYLKCSTTTLKQRLNYGPDRVWPGYLRFRREDEIFREYTEEEIEKELSKYGGSFEVPMYLLDVKTGIETRFDTKADCARHLGCAESGVHQRLEDGPDRVWPGYYRFRKEDNTFKAMSDQEVEDSLNEYSDPTSRPVLVKWYATDAVEEFPSPKTAAIRLNSSRTAVTRYASEPDQFLYWLKESPFQVQYKDLFKEWRVLGDLFDELEKTRKLQQIFVTDEHWNFLEVHSDSFTCSKVHDIKRGTMLNIINTNGERVYNGKRFMRELYYYRHFGKPDWLTV